MKQIEPYSESSNKTSRVEPKSDLHGNHVERAETVKSSFTHSDDDTKEIKNIYVDSKLLFQSYTTFPGIRLHKVGAQ